MECLYDMYLTGMKQVVAKQQWSRNAVAKRQPLHCPLAVAFTHAPYSALLSRASSSSPDETDTLPMRLNGV